jgi:hypothetical protein
MNVPAQKQNTDVSTNKANPFLTYGQHAAQQTIVGTLLRFTKGDYLAGQEDEEVAVGTRYVVNMDELMVGWIRWSDNKPTDHVMGRISDAYEAPRRSELGDNDKSQWEVDGQGKERDPWQFSNYMVLWNPKNTEQYTFATSSGGGIKAIGKLSITYGKQMAQHPDEFPIIELGVETYDHKLYGRMKNPTFKIVGWETKGVFADGVVEETGTGGGAAAAAAPGGAENKSGDTASAAPATPAAAAGAATTASAPAAKPAAAPAAGNKPRF